MPLILKNKQVNCLNLGCPSKQNPEEDLSKGIVARNNSVGVGGVRGGSKIWCKCRLLRLSWWEMEHNSSEKLIEWLLGLSIAGWAVGGISYQVLSPTGRKLSSEMWIPGSPGLWGWTGSWGSEAGRRTMYSTLGRMLPRRGGSGLPQEPSSTGVANLEMGWWNVAWSIKGAATWITKGKHGVSRFVLNSGLKYILSNSRWQRKCMVCYCFALSLFMCFFGSFLKSLFQP